MTKRQRAARLKKTKRLAREKKARKLFIFNATYGRQVSAVVKFWSEQLTSQVADFDNGERDVDQVRMQVEAIGKHADMAARLTPEQILRFEQALNVAIIQELKYLLHLTVGLDYEPKPGSVLHESLLTAGIRPGKFVLPWDNWTHIGPNGVKVCRPSGEEDLPLTAVA